MKVMKFIKLAKQAEAYWKDNQKCNGCPASDVCFKVWNDYPEVCEIPKVLKAFGVEVP